MKRGKVADAWEPQKTAGPGKWVREEPKLKKKARTTRKNVKGKRKVKKEREKKGGKRGTREK